jgi:S-formylglutathione hydrolase FrmB
MKMVVESGASRIAYSALRSQPVPTTRWIGVVAAVLLANASTCARSLGDQDDLRLINRRLQGQVIDYTHNHGADHRIWSPALGQRRDLYVYLPPGFDPGQRYPVVLFLHAFIRDEQFFLHSFAERFDRAIVAGKLPPMIVAAPDGSIQGRPTLLQGASFFLNSNAGNFEDFLVHDVWRFLIERYPLRPEREAHVLFGCSMGGGAAFNLAIKHQDQFRIAVGISPPLNVRWVDCHDRYWTPFDLCCWSWRSQLRPHEMIGRYAGGLIRVPLKLFSDPLYGRGKDAVPRLSWENPAELLERFDVREGQLAMYVAYGGKDQLNIMAQVESFLALAHQRGLSVAVDYDPQGKHNIAAAVQAFPSIIEWLRPRLAPYSPLRP